MKHQKLFAIIWAAIVAFLFAHAIHLWVTQRIAPDTDILTLLPMQEQDATVRRAFANMADAAQQKIIVLVGARDWEQARQAADAYRGVLSPHANVFAFADKLGEQTQQDWLSVFQKHAAPLMTTQDTDALRTRDSQFWVNAAMSKLYSPFAGPKLGTWQDDPFGLFGNWVQARAQETPVRPRDGYLYVANSERHYVVLPINLQVPAFSMSAQEQIIPLLTQARQAATKTAGAEVLEAGVILHAAAAGKQASAEMSTIGIGSLIGIILMIWIAFRSIKPFAYISLLIAVGFLGALTISLLLFGRVHLLTLVFGATLIGVAQDYGIYYLCHRVGTDASVTSPQLLRRLLPSLGLTLVAAAVGYMGLAFTPFPGLRQMAVFSVSGLLFAWLTVVFWYPVLISPLTLKNNAARAQKYASLLRYWPVLRNNRGSAIAVFLLAAFLVVGWSRLGINDDIRSLQNPPKHLLEEQIKLAKLLDAPTPMQFYLVRGQTAELVLQREEALKARLDVLVTKQTISGFHAISNWVPSTQIQVERLKLLNEKLFADGRALSDVIKTIGEDAALVQTARQRLAATSTLSPDEFLQTKASEPWRHLWLGKQDGAYASIVALRGAGMAALPQLRDAAIGIEGVQWIDKVSEISSLLGRYRLYMGWALLFSYFGVFCLLFVRYRFSTWRVLAPTALASGLTLALLGLAGQQLQLFHVLALVLLLGIGVDYGVFFQERPDKREASAWMAVSLSAVSTLLGFGLLGLSKTPALQAFGLTMLIGTTLVWLIVPCVANGQITETDAAASQLEEICG